MTIKWYGLVAPEQAATGDRRMFKAQSLTYRDFPLPSAWQRVSSSGHQGSVVVASWDRQYAGDGGIWGSGEFLDPRIVPEVTEAIYLLEKRLIGPSVDLDPDLAYEIVDHPTLAGEFAMQVTRATVHGVTFVQGPAFPQVHITVDDEDEMALLASAGITIATFAVDKSSWKSWPLAPRETTFDADTAIANIAAWSGGDASKFGSAFLWQDKQGNPNNRESYRLPLADVLDGRLTLVPRAVFSAGTIMSGAHGGLYDTLPENERTQVQQVLTQIYDMLRDEYGDPRVVAPWQRGGRAGATSSDGQPTEASMDPEVYAAHLTFAMDVFQSRLNGELERYWTRGEGAAKIRWGEPGDFKRCVRQLREHFPQDTEGLCANLHHEALGKWPGREHTMEAETFTVRSSGWSSMPTSTAAWDEGAARQALDEWAGDSIEKYGRAFLWSDGSGNKTGFKFPIAKPVDGTLTIFIRAVNNAKARLSSASIPSGDKDRILSILNSIQKRYGGGDEEAALTASGVLAPPKEWFANPKFSKATKLTITEDGRVFGHLATWKRCHLGVGNRCQMAPKSKSGYKFFHLGSVLCEDGTDLSIGKITLGTGHADKTFGVRPAADHYDNTGTCVAVVRAGEDRYGVFVAGALVADTPAATVAELRRSPLSGDWRRVDGNLELVAALAVNDPGFPVVHDDEDGVYSLTAAGVFEDSQTHHVHELDEIDGAAVLASVDSYLESADRASRAQVVQAAFNDLLPTDEGCGCNVRL